MLVLPVEMDSLDSLEDDAKFDLRDLFSIAPRPAAMPVREEDDEDEEDDESGDDSTESDESESTDSDESDDEDDEDEDEKAKTAKLIKDLRTENKSRRLANRKLQRELDALKAEAKKKPPVKRSAKAAEEEDDTDEDPTKLTSREEAVEIKSELVDVMSELDIDKRYRRIILALVDPDEVEFEVSDSGRVTVNGLKEAVEELLEDYPEWSAKTSDDSDDDKEKFRKNGSTNNRKKGQSGLDRASLAKKYSALATR